MTSKIFFLVFFTSLQQQQVILSFCELISVQQSNMANDSRSHIMMRYLIIARFHRILHRNQSVCSKKHNIIYNSSRNNMQGLYRGLRKFESCFQQSIIKQEKILFIQQTTVHPNLLFHLPLGFVFIGNTNRNLKHFFLYTLVPLYAVSIIRYFSYPRFELFPHKH